MHKDEGQGKGKKMLSPTRKYLSKFDIDVLDEHTAINLHEHEFWGLSFLGRFVGMLCFIHLLPANADTFFPSPLP